MPRLRPALITPFFALVLAIAQSVIAEKEESVAEEVYLAPETFISETFGGHSPDPQVLWLTKSLKPEIKEILGHDYPAIRIRYWRSEERSAWILEEIGKTQPITVGIAVEDDKIVRLKVLVYRESHGWEVKYPFFTDQFEDATLEEDLKLSKNIDGIAGATLSVSALERLSRLALFLHQSTSKD